MSLSAIVPVTEPSGPVVPVLEEYLRALADLGQAFELICVFDVTYADNLSGIEMLKERFPQLKSLRMPRSFGDATAISIGFEASSGRKVLLLPPYRHVVLDDLTAVIAAADESDVVVGRREPRRDGWFNRLQTQVFSALIGRISGLRLKDAGCIVRVVSRPVLEEVQLYGDFHRFLPMLADRQGFTVAEVPIRQTPEDQRTRVYRPGVYIRRFLDLLSVYFILRFTKKPFRFFGLIGSAVMAVGAVTTIWVVVERLAYGQNLADRPALLLGSLLLVFGLQILSVGLIGEIIIFSHAREMKEFNIKRIIE